MIQKPELDSISHDGDRFSIIRLVFDSEVKQSEHFYRELRTAIPVDFTFVTIGVRNWNHDLSPWCSPPVFGKDGFGDGATDLLGFIEGNVVPDIVEPIIIGGYSLTGLFSLWSGYESKSFRNIAAISPSVWFPGWIDYASERRIQADSVYLSLGNKESHTKNEVVSKVAENLCKQYDLLCDNTDCILEWNEGGHFDNVERRVVDAFIKITNMLYKTTHNP